MEWGKLLAGAVAFTFEADGLLLGGLGGVGVPRVDKPIAAAKIEFMPSSFYQQNSVGKVLDMAEGERGKSSGNVATIPYTISSPELVQQTSP